MKTPHLSLFTLGFFSSILALTAPTATAQSSFSDIDVSNDASIGSALRIGQVQLGSTAGSTSHGVRLSVSQGAQENVWQSVITPGYYQDNFVSVEDYGDIWTPGYNQPQYEWGIVSYNYFPATYDENGVEITAEYYEPVYGNVYTGDIWIEGYNTWGVIGTHQENQQIWIPETTQSYSEWVYDAPIIHSSATRSDANWVWDVPTGDGNTRTVLRLWDGGMALPDASGATNMTLSPTGLQYVLPGGSQYATYAAGSAEWHSNSATVQEKAEQRPELIRFTRSETANGTTTSSQTQISARSASFGGVVEVTGDLKVIGTLRVPKRGDISMGEFTNGPQP